MNEERSNVVEIRRKNESDRADLLELARIVSGGGGGSSTGMEARLAKVEAAVEYIQRDMSEIRTDVRALRDNARTDFRLLFGAIIFVALGLAGLMARGFHWL
jgi:hypothetical protein